MWTAVVITSNKSINVSVIQNELERLQKKEKINKEATILTVEDPEVGIGSGSATLNALLAVAEHLSVKNDYQVVTADVLNNAKILILHHGREYPFDPLGKAFLTLPKEVTNCKDRTLKSAGLVTNLEEIYCLVSELASACPFGVWVCSTEMLLTGKLIRPLQFPSNCDVILFSTLELVDYATQHGTIEIGSKNYVENIIYMGSCKQLQQLSSDGEKVPVVSGIVFLSVPVAENLLSLHVLAPLDSCTYLGQDNGAKSLQVSLYFDILTTMTTKATEKNFVIGDYCKSYNTKHGYEKEFSKAIQHARRLVWNVLHKYKMKTCILEDMHHKYWNESRSAAHHVKILNDFSQTHFNHVAVTDSMIPKKDLLVTNSFLQFTTVGENSVIQHCHLQGSSDHTIVIGKCCYLIGVHIEIKSIPFSLKDELVLIETSIIDDDLNVKKIRILFGLFDFLFTPFHSIDATFCNISWKNLFDQTQITANDLWDKDKVTNLMTARLFPLSSDIAMLQLLQNLHHISPTQLNEWKSSRRLSIHDVLSRSASAAEFNTRQQLFCKITSYLTELTLIHNSECSLLPYFKCSVIEGWHMKLLHTLDNVAQSFDYDNWNPGKAARTLACIADLLGIMAGKDGGLRSGPAANLSWLQAFNILDKGTKGSIAFGIKALTEERKNWLDLPIKLTRAARHYEGAAQILIRHAVTTANQFVHLEPSSLPPLEQWIIAECPARVDLQGGWSDTPPICYELGGSVVNVALLIEGKRPIGAKAKRIAEPIIEFLMGADETSAKRISIDHLDKLTDYKHLTAAGALLKVAVIYANVVDVQSEQNLRDQLLKKYGGGIQLQTWSNLPQGSGLGTSSILAGAILAVVWSVTGNVWTQSSLIHGVLCLEQMLTTGGGWQDQVGGIIGGVILASSDKSLPVNVKIEKIPLSPEFLECFNQHILLVYTGKVRLAKNLLQNVIRNWYARDSDIVKCFQELVENAHLCKSAFLEENLSKIGKLMDKYWQQKVIIAPGCDPVAIREIMNRLQPLVYGQTLAGAGGGGFIVVLTKEPNMKKQIQHTLHDLQANVTVYDTVIDTAGMMVSCKQ